MSALLRGRTSKNNDDFYCLNCLHSSRKKTKLESDKKACENKDFYNVIISSEDTKILLKHHLLFIKKSLKYHLLFM